MPGEPVVVNIYDMVSIIADEINIACRIGVGDVGFRLCIFLLVNIQLYCSLYGLFVGTCTFLFRQYQIYSHNK